ncbi:glycosyltransferase family 2 protein [Reichenbachiella sp. MSK19-1]|uniref:glycosyltransferase family 2 protein n=1 Tax=Reichenbachiella sp. MSK19-1 TaxID=1897631 RepID=UPI000E6B79D0|nr:glycosyltransferase family 2 protein [Reichenbachiella sp. MSK19-1]RJE70861.1 hypothetical protein BGP76_08745 [Reichenbachiella sp. MSK19-1]
MPSLISIITPVHNAESYIAETIQSVLNQSYSHWELLVINNASTDGSETEILKAKDPRIKYFYEGKKGVGFARNKGLEEVKGEFLCFLDADDIMPKNSLSSRLQIFNNNPQLQFVDGAVQYVDQNLKMIDKKYSPSFKGYPYNELLRLNAECLFGNTWMIKLQPNRIYRFDTQMTHAEDLYFYLTICEGGLYSYTNETILLYRQRPGSAMKNLKGLEKGYIKLIQKINRSLKIKNWRLSFLKLKIAKIMFLSHTFDGRDFISGFMSIFKILAAK